MTPEALSYLHERAFAPERGWSPDEFRALLAGRGIHLVTRKGAFLLGRALVGEAEILTLATEPEMRRRGLGRDLLIDFIEISRSESCDRIFLEVASDNAAARALYAAAGFVEAGTRPRYYAREGRPNVDAILMQRDLGAHVAGK